MEPKPPQEPTPAQAAEDAAAVAAARVIPHVEFKALLLLALTTLLVLAFLAYVLYARGTFESEQKLVLVTDNSEGVFVGLDLTFAGFAIGRVRRIELGDDGKAHIEIAVPKKDARWLRASSVFTLERSLVGATSIRAFTGYLEDAPLPDGAVRSVLRGDASEQIPRLIASMRQLLENLERLSAGESNLGQSLANVRTLTERMAGKHGALGGLLGGEENARKVILAIDRSNALLHAAGGLVAEVSALTAKAGGVADQVGGMALRLDATLARADQRLLGAGGIADESQAAIRQINAMLAEARDSLKKVDGVLAEAQKIGSNTRAATEDLGTLRAEVEASLRRVAGLIEEINRKWPFARDTEIKLP